MSEQRPSADHIRVLVRRLRAMLRFGSKRAVSVAVIVALFSTVLAASPALASGQRDSILPTATGTSASAVADPLPPSTITLTSNRTEISAGQSASLTAEVDQPLQNTSSVVQIVDRTTGETLRSCSTGTTCLVDTVFYTGGPHTFVATVNGLTSGDVVVKRKAWTVSLAVSKTSFTAGQKVNLTATANQSPANTNGSYLVYVLDLTTGSIVGSCSIMSPSLTCVFTTVFYTGGAHEYQAVVAASTDPTTDVQATSNTVTAERKEPDPVSRTVAVG